jgi:branched-chain amino acid aminotransferase
MSTTAPTHTIHLQPTATPVPDERRAELMENPGFGRVFTDHMVTAQFTDGGWRDATLRPYGPLSLDPATAVMHYAQEIFEGLKAYRQPDGGTALFRPERNAARFNYSASRLSMAPLPEELFLESIRALVNQDRAWVPTFHEGSLYLRPFMFASEPFLGVRPALQYFYGLIASPVGAYFPRGVKPVNLWLSVDRVRAVPGGTGDAKTGGNYAASLVAQAEATEAGCDQVVFLDAVERRWVEELGGMNIFFVFDDGAGGRRLVTPPLTGSLLAGITRDSLLTLAGDHGYRVEERPVSVDEWRTSAADGSLAEVFACGTAAVITPIGRVRSKAGEFVIADGEAGPITMELRQSLLDIQYGMAPDKHNWMRPV